MDFKDEVRKLMEKYDECEKRSKITYQLAIEAIEKTKAITEKLMAINKTLPEKPKTENEIDRLYYEFSIPCSNDQMENLKNFWIECNRLAILCYPHVIA